MDFRHTAINISPRPNISVLRYCAEFQEHAHLSENIFQVKIKSDQLNTFLHFRYLSFLQFSHQNLPSQHQTKSYSCNVKLKQQITHCDFLLFLATSLFLLGFSLWKRKGEMIQGQGGSLELCWIKKILFHAIILFHHYWKLQQLQPIFCTKTSSKFVRFWVKLPFHKPRNKTDEKA